MTDLAEQSESGATDPKAVTTDGMRVDAQDADSLIEADKNLAGKTGVASANRGPRFNKLAPPGSTA